MEGCDRPARARLRCGRHYEQLRYATESEYRRKKIASSMKRYAANPAEGKERTRQWQLANPEKKRRHAINAAHRNRARKAGVEVDPNLDAFAVYEEDGYVCQLCGGDIDPSLKGNHPGMATLDHIEPVVLGGSHTRSNVRTAHLQCNVIRSLSSRVVVLNRLGAT